MWYIDNVGLCGIWCMDIHRSLYDYVSGLGGIYLYNVDNILCGSGGIVWVLMVFMVTSGKMTVFLYWFYGVSG